MATTYQRQRPPANYMFEVHNFLELVKSKVEGYQGNLFDAGGYKWRMVVYPNGDKGSEGNVSVGVMIDEVANAEKLPPSWHVYADVKVFVFNWNTKKYLVHDLTCAEKYTQYDQAVRTYVSPRFVNLDIFKNEANGYLRKGCCIFGAEILVMERSALKAEKLNMVRNPRKGRFPWEINQYRSKSMLTPEEEIQSPPFTVEGIRWKIAIYLNGFDKARGNWVSIYLTLVDAANLPAGRQVYAEYKLRVVNQFDKSNAEKTHTYWFSSSNTYWGTSDLLRLGDLVQKDKGFVVADTLIVEAEITCISVST